MRCDCRLMHVWQVAWRSSSKRCAFSVNCSQPGCQFLVSLPCRYSTSWVDSRRRSRGAAAVVVVGEGSKVGQSGRTACC